MGWKERTSPTTWNRAVERRRTCCFGHCCSFGMAWDEGQGKSRREGKEARGGGGSFIPSSIE